MPEHEHGIRQPAGDIDQARLRPALRTRTRARRACLNCGRPAIAARCPTCATTHERQRGTTTQRGLGADHQRRRAHLIPLALGTPCPLCGQTMRPGQALDLDHSTPRAHDPHSIGDRIVHATCNRRAGATVRRHAA